MRKILLLMVLMGSLVSFNAMSQCGQIGLIGEMTGWSEDIMMDRDMNNPDLFTAIITVAEVDDTDTSGFVDMKFRANHDWGINWGDTTFPTGVGLPGGDNIPVPYGSWAVSFNCATGEYAYTATCGDISLIGEMTSWTDDIMMMRIPDNNDLFVQIVTVDTTMDSDSSGFVDMKFRANQDWGTNWGDTTFPIGVGLPGGPNIPVPYGTWAVAFDCGTGEYEYTSTCDEIGIIGEFNGWSADYWMKRSHHNPNEWTVVLTLTADMEDDNPNDTIELKFRAGADWGTNWGGEGWPTGTGVNGGPNIKVPLTDEGITTDYAVTFNCETGEYSFVTTSGPISMIGEFNGWNGDVPMNRDMDDPNLWKLTRSWYVDSPVKFRENADWTMAWGNTGWPSGIGESDNGPNIPLVAGIYDVTFNTTTFEYNFVENTEVCGEVGMIGDFNTWGDDGSDVPTDVYLVRDPMYPSQFSLTYNFTSSTLMFFRMDADPLFEDVWGGTFPSGQAINDGGATQFNVPGGKYHITYNCVSHDFNFERLGNAVIAPKVFAINVDGNLDEADWKITENVSGVIYGTTETPDTIYFGVTYNSEYLYVGASVITAGDVNNLNSVVFCVDGNKSGGDLDASDIVFGVDGAGSVFVMHGPEGYTPDAFFVAKDGGYTVETGILWSELGVTAEEGGGASFDIMVGNGYDYTADPPEGFVMAWNGNMDNVTSSSAYGDLIYGALSCGCVSLYNETIGDVKLRNQLALESTTTYVGTYEMDNAYDVVFRKDGSSTVSWSTDAFPAGTATLDGPMIPAIAGRYRVTFDCITGEYTFGEALSGDAIAMAQYTDTPPTIDGDLGEYDLAYGSDILADTLGSSNNNTVTWGLMWDIDNLYIAAHVVDALVQGPAGEGSPWENDGIELYIDGDNSKDGTYSAESFDTQLIMDAANESTLWAKADGVAITDEESIWVATSDGYSIEIRLGWAQLGFSPGKGRTIGWSLGNNDTDTPEAYREYQTLWYGSGKNWSDNSLLGDLELAGGPYFDPDGLDEHVLYNANIVLYPNPTAGNVSVRSDGDVFSSHAVIYVSDITGRTIAKTNANFKSNSTVQLNVGNLTNGIYFVNIISEDGKRAVKKLIVH